MRRRRLYAGTELQQLRTRLGLSQSDVATAAGISVPYVSQLESNYRPLTGAVMVALSRAFPHHWGDLVGTDEALLMAVIDAGEDVSVLDARLHQPQLVRTTEQQPGSQDQNRLLNDTLEASAVDSSRMPWEEVRDWFHAQGNYIDELDRGAERLSISTERHVMGFTDRLRSHHDVAVATIDSGGEQLHRFDPTGRSLAIDRALPPETVAFQLAHQLVQLELAEVIDHALANAGLRFEASRQLLTVGLANYAAGALMMPYKMFRDAAQRHRHDIDQLRLSFGVSFEQACHRLSTLQRPGANGVPMFFLRIDMAGNITKRHSATPLQFARFGGACPLRIVHEAVAIPDRILVQRAEMPDGTRYISMAKGLVKPSGSYARAPRRYAVALGCEESAAADFVYADGARTQPPTPIGISCRICQRTNCHQRAFPPAGSTLSIPSDVREIVPYRFR